MAAVPAPQPPADHHPPLIAAAAPRVESLGHAAKLGAPGDELVEALLGLLRDSDPLAPGLFAEAGDATGRRTLLLLRCRPDVELRQRTEDHDLVVLDRDLHSLEPAVWEPSGKPTLDRSELFVIHNYMITLQNRICQGLTLQARRGESPRGRRGRPQ